MKLKNFILFGLLALCFACICNIPRSTASAATKQVTFDFNKSRIEKYLPENVTDKLNNVTYECLDKFATEPTDISSTVLLYYNYYWTVNGVKQDPATYEITQSTTFVAVWEPIEYNIHYYYLTSEEYTDITNIRHNEKYSIENPVKYYKPNRPYYNFIDWYASPQLDGIPQLSTNKDFSDKVLYAKWQPIEYYINYHTDADNQDNPYSFNVESPTYQLQAPKKEGHIFLGWYLDPQFTYKYDVIEKGSYDNLDLYPLWELEEYDVKYIMPDGEVQNIRTKYGSNADTPKNTNNIFEIVIYEGNRENIKADTMITVKYVNIWYVYVIALALIVGIIVAIILVKRHKDRQLHKLRYIYHSNFR